jgi:hypothetical protein
VSAGAVVREGGKWYSIYSYRTSSAVLPGLRLLGELGRWPAVDQATRRGPALRRPESVYIEWHQIYRIGQRYVMLYEGYNGGTRWGADIAISDHLTRGLEEGSLGMIDQTK